MPAGKQVYRQTDEGDANADEGADSGVNTGHEQLAGYDVQTAYDGKYGDYRVKGNLVLALKVRLLTT